MRDHPQGKAYLALVSVCFFWGTTYLAIRMALEGFPPLKLVSLRFLLSGALMLAIVRLARLPLPRGRELAWTALNGVLILGIGNGCLVFSETLIPSSLAALFIAISPFWMVGIEAIVPGGERLRLRTSAAMLLGFAGAAILVLPDLWREGLRGSVWQGFLLLQLGSAFWSLGSIWQRRIASRAHPIASGAVQQLAAGLAFALPAALESAPLEHNFGRPFAALLYLVVFGSIVGYSSYVYALQHLPVALVSIYSYVNPIVAAALGWLVYREPFGKNETTAMALIFLAVALVKRTTTQNQRPSA